VSSISEEKIVSLKVNDIIPDPKNLRQVFDEQEIRALADNLLEIGQTDPIQVFKREDNNTYDLFDGERRWRAAKLAGIDELKAIVIPRPTRNELLVKKVSRIMQTKTLSFPEEVNALEEGLTALGCSNDQSKWPHASRMLGVPLQVLKERMRIRQLSPKLQENFEKGSLDYTIAQTLGRIPDTKRQEDLASFIEENNLHNRFVTTKFIQAALEAPDKSPIEIYDLARLKERFRYAEPRVEDLPTSTVDKLDTILLDMHKIQGWLETISRENVLDELSESQFNSRRFWMTTFRLNGMIEAFIRVNFPKYYPNYNDDAQILSEVPENVRKTLPPGKREMQ
jgi:ParB family transcriptional regulator, chromosome partitioning protein